MEKLSIPDLCQLMINHVHEYMNYMIQNEKVNYNQKSIRSKYHLHLGCASKFILDDEVIISHINQVIEEMIEKESIEKIEEIQKEFKTCEGIKDEYNDRNFAWNSYLYTLFHLIQKKYGSKRTEIIAKINRYIFPIPMNIFEPNWWYQFKNKN